MRILIIGASKGIGRAVAEELALLGANVIVMARSQDLLQQAVAALPNNGNQQHHYIVADNSQPQALREAVVTFMQQHKLFSIHILVNNTGGPAGGPAIDAKPDEFISAFTNHLLCNQHLAQVLVPGMKDAGFGRIINISSVVATLGNPGQVNYVSSKAAIEGLTRALSKEVAKKGITVNAVAPGFIETEMTSGLSEELKNYYFNQIPMQRFGTPEDVAEVVLFLAEKASYMTGQTLHVNGGMIG